MNEPNVYGGFRESLDIAHFLFEMVDSCRVFVCLRPNVFCCLFVSIVLFLCHLLGLLGWEIDGSRIKLQ